MRCLIVSIPDICPLLTRRSNTISATPWKLSCIGERTKSWTLCYWVICWCQWLGYEVRLSYFWLTLLDRLKHACSATETTEKHWNLHVTRITAILSRKWTTVLLISLRVCAGWSASLLLSLPRKCFLGASLSWRQWRFLLASVFVIKGDETKAYYLHVFIQNHRSIEPL